MATQSRPSVFCSPQVRPGRVPSPLQMWPRLLCSAVSRLTSANSAPTAIGGYADFGYCFTGLIFSKIATSALTLGKHPSNSAGKGRV
mmetsp:Transcript_25898/g.44577  ORF Transcript_25898/g.44577 Transcript_25898/m.44577 type:complete len:87 (+) Transcript_25898:190-450(+)